MRHVSVLLALLVACGGGNKKKDDAGSDAIGIDAPPAVACAATPATKVAVRKIGAVTGGAILATSPPGDPRLFVLEQDGRIRIFKNEQLAATPFLDISGVTGFAAGGEQGLLGLAFPASYAQNGTFYIFYTTSSANVLASYHVSAGDPDVADPSSGQILLSIPDFASNHNGGMIELGADGYLYIGTGDGGGGGDPHRNAQAIDRTAASCTASACEPLLGKMLRLDVDHPANGKPYGIPLGNPFAMGGGEPEIFMVGLRNPWRWAFDRANGDMWIGDVGQDVDEELDVLVAGQQAGKNLGWSMYEANRAYGNYPADPTGKTFPQVVKNHTTDGWHAIIGGQVYRGTMYPELRGCYFYTDNSAHPLSMAILQGDGTVTTTDLTPPSAGWPASPSSLHADSRGELYETTTSGDVYHLEVMP